MSANRETWMAPVNLTPKMIDRMIGNADFGRISRSRLEEALRIAWAEARYASAADTVDRLRQSRRAS